MIDREGKTTFLNPRMAEMLGSTVADLMGRSPDEFLDEKGRRLLGEKLALRRIGKRNSSRFASFAATAGRCLR